MTRLWSWVVGFVGFVGFVGLVVGYEVEEVTRLRESSSYGYSNIEAEANFVKFSEDLYMSNDMFCLPLLGSSPNASCLPCSYSGETCPTHVDPFSSQFSRETQDYLASLPLCTCFEDACDISEVTQDPHLFVEVTPKYSKFYRYEHNSWDLGFVIKQKSLTNYAPTTTISTDPSFAVNKIVATSTTDHIQVCPSHPLFGARENTITYFISIQSTRETKIELSIETLPNDESHGEPEPFVVPGPDIFWYFSDQNLDEGAYTRLEGTYAETFGVPFAVLSPMLILYPLDGCGLYSLKSEVIQYSGSFWAPGIFVGVVTETEVGYLPKFAQGIFNCEECFRSAEFLQLGSLIHAVSQDSVLSFCPKTDEQNYIMIFIYTSATPWIADFFLRKAPESPFLTSHDIADPHWSYIQVQERLENLFTLNLPCLGDETCRADPPSFSFITRRNLMGPDYFPSLLYPVDSGDREDMIPEIAFQTNRSFFLRCQSRTRDSGCGVFSVYKGGEYASPLVFPALEPLYSLNPLPSLNAQDLTTIFPFSARTLIFFVTVGVESEAIISQQRYQESTLIFGNPNWLHTKSYETSRLDNIRVADFKPEPPSDCTSETFYPLSELYTYLHSVLEASQRAGGDMGPFTNYLDIDPQTANYYSYTLFWTKEWQSCWKNALSLHQFGEREIKRSNSTLCTDNDLDDPCCNPRLAWSDCCSGKNRDVVEVQSLPLSVNQNNIEKKCDDPGCMGILAPDFREIYQNAIVNKICVVNDEISPYVNDIFQYCTTLYIGQQPVFGVPCSSNSDCDYLGDPDGYCDLMNKKCVVDSEAQENAFLQCLIDRMDDATKTLIYRQLAIGGVADPNDVDGDIFLTADLLRQYAVDGKTRCFDDYGPLFDHHEYFTLQQPIFVTSTCPVCNDGDYLTVRCLTILGCETPIQCQDTSESCYSNSIAVTPSCSSPTDICDHNNNITTEEECQEDGNLCLYCSNSTNCVQLPASDQNECENTPICILNDGEVLWGVDEDECERREKCSEGMGDEDECLEAGECNDPDNIVGSIEALIPFFPSLETARNGVCITPLNPSNTPACNLLRPGAIFSLDFTTQRGCVRLGQCVFDLLNGIFRCPHDPATEEDCVNLFGGSWLSLPILNEQDCENPRGVDESESPGFCKANFQAEYLSPLDRSDCEGCGGEPTPPATWEPLKWAGGTSARGEWRQGRMVPKYSVSSSSVSYFRLEELFDRAILNYETFILWSGESCLLHPFVHYVEVVTCDCPLGDDPIPEEDFENPFSALALTGPVCDENENTENIGTSWFCPNIDLRIGFTFGVITTLSEYVSGDLCFSSEIAFASLSSFVGNRPSEPITVVNDPNDLDPSPVRNQNGASVGIVLGDGFAFELSQNIQPIDWINEVEGVQLTCTVDPSVFEDNDIPDWYILDFGLEVVDESLKTQPSDEIELQPVGATVGTTVGREVGSFLIETEEGDQLPVVIDGVLMDPFRYQKSARIYPIARLPDWEDENRDEALSTGEAAMVGVFAGLYGLAFFVTIFFLVNASHNLNFSLLILFFYLLLTFSFRTAFWAIVASGDYEEPSAGYYILIEPPSFFILSVLTVLMMSYTFIVAASQGKENLGVYWLLWFLMQIFLIAVLFIVVGLMIGLDNNDVITTSCFGRESSVEQNTTVRDIRIAYHSFILFVAIICFGYTIKLGRDLPDGENKSLLQFMSSLAGLTVVLTSLLWVIYSAIDNPSPYFVIPLFFTEVPPLILMCYLVFPSQKKYEGQEIDL